MRRFLIMPSQAAGAGLMREGVLWSDGSADVRGVRHYPRFDELVAAVADAESQIVWVDGPGQPRLDDDLRCAALARLLDLSDDDAALLERVFLGHRNDEIARALGVPAGTVKSRLARICRALGVQNRVAVAVLASQVLAGSSLDLASSPAIEALAPRMIAR